MIEIHAFYTDTWADVFHFILRCGPLLSILSARRTNERKKKINISYCELILLSTITEINGLASTSTVEAPSQ